MFQEIQIRKGLYYDSVKLMLVSKAIADIEGVIKASVVMGTELNKENLFRQEMDNEESRKATSSDLIISIEAETEDAIRAALEEMEKQLSQNAESGNAESYRPRSFEGAMRQQPGSNVAIVSVPGAHAASVAREALEAGLHVMLFSDNVPIEDERSLKEYSTSHDLLLMGPDCGTAVINGVPLGFANVVENGPVGMVSASGTGSQEVMTLLDSFGVGITQAIGTGGRDLKEDVGGLTYIQALDALNADDATKVIVLISKPPSPSIADKIFDHIKTNVAKPVVVNLIGAKPQANLGENVHFASSLEECAEIAAALAKGCEIAPLWDDEVLNGHAAEVRAAIPQGASLMRAFYSGGTLAYEAELALREKFGDVLTNLSGSHGVNPVDGEHHVAIDFGEDEYTVGRAHPMIDSTLRAQAFEAALDDAKTAVIVVDFVLGYGASMTPQEDFIKLMAERDEHAPVIAVVVGTERDPQVRSEVVRQIEAAGFIVAPSNKAAVELASRALIS